MPFNFCLLFRLQDGIYVLKQFYILVRHKITEMKSMENGVNLTEKAKISCLFAYLIENLSENDDKKQILSGGTKRKL